MDGVLVAFGSRITDVASGVGLAALPGRACEDLARRLDQPLMRIRDHQVDSSQSSVHEVSEEAQPALEALGVPQLTAQEPPHAVLPHAHREHQRHRLHPRILSYFQVNRVDEQEREVLLERAIPPGVDELVELERVSRDRGLGELLAAELLCDFGDAASAHAADDHLDEGGDQGAFGTRVALEESGGEGAVAVAWDAEGELADACGELAVVVAISAAGARLGALVTLCLEVVVHLRFEGLLEHALGQDAQRIGVAAQKGLEGVGIERNLFVRHRVLLRSWFGDFDRKGRGGGFASSAFSHALLLDAHA